MSQIVTYSSIMMNTFDTTEEEKTTVIPFILKQYTSIDTINVKDLCENYSKKIPLYIILKFAGIDMDEPRTKFFYSLSRNCLLKIDENILSWLGYKGLYNEQKRNLVNLLKRNEIPFTKDLIPGSKYGEYSILILGKDFERAIQKSTTTKCLELQDLYSKIKEAMSLYEKYEKQYKL
nr:MAG: hypothetical protein [Apis mellifra filamentous-like virus]